MKKILHLIIVFSLFTGLSMFQAKAQEDTTQFLLSDKVELSGFGAPFVEFSSINKQFAVCLGGGAALVINQTFYIGGYFEGIMTNHYMQDLDTIVNIEKPKVSFEHGGIWLGYVYKPKKAVHGGLSMKLGWGEINLEGDGYNYNPDVEDFNDRIFSIIPQVEVELNMTKWFKINVGIGYRFVTGIDAPYHDEQGNLVNFYSDSDFNSPVGTISLIFGGHNKEK